MEIRSLTDLEARSLRSRCQRAWFLPRLRGRTSSVPLPSFLSVVSRSPWCPLACRRIPPGSSSVVRWHSPCVYPCVSSHEDTSHWISTHSHPERSHLNLANYTCKDLISKSHNILKFQVDMNLGGHCSAQYTIYEGGMRGAWHQRWYLAGSLMVELPQVHRDFPASWGGPKLLALDLEWRVTFLST